MVAESQRSDRCSILETSARGHDRTNTALTPRILPTPLPVLTSVTKTSSPIVVMIQLPSWVSKTGPPVYSGRNEDGDAR